MAAKKLNGDLEKTLEESKKKGPWVHKDWIAKRIKHEAEKAVQPFIANKLLKGIRDSQPPKIVHYAILAVAIATLFVVVFQSQPSLMISTNQKSITLGEDKVHFWVLNNGTTVLKLDTSYDVELWCDGKNVKTVGIVQLGENSIQDVEVSQAAFYVTSGKINVHESVYKDKNSCNIRVHVESLITRASNTIWIPVELPKKEVV